MSRIGLFGGTFDPPHIGHLLLAEIAQVQLALDYVWWLPVGDPTHKTRPDLSAAHHRAAMVSMLIENHPAFMLDMNDVEREPPHYTATLLPFICDERPDDDFWLLIGGDSLHHFDTWFQPETILSYCRLGVLHRPSTFIDWDKLESNIEGDIRDQVDLLAHDGVAISSTDIRALSRLDHPHTYTTVAIQQYIKQHHLYDN